MRFSDLCRRRWELHPFIFILLETLNRNGTQCKPTRFFLFVCFFFTVPQISWRSFNFRARPLIKRTHEQRKSGVIPTRNSPQTSLIRPFSVMRTHTHTHTTCPGRWGGVGGGDSGTYHHDIYTLELEPSSAIRVAADLNQSLVLRLLLVCLGVSTVQRNMLCFQPRRPSHEARSQSDRAGGRDFVDAG